MCDFALETVHRKYLFSEKQQVFDCAHPEDFLFSAAVRWFCNSRKNLIETVIMTQTISELIDQLSVNFEGLLMNFFCKSFADY